MQISQAGLDFIKSFEGYHRRLPNGDCTTYYCPAGVLTIGYGCTEGIREGMVWTHDQALQALRTEIAKHEAAVNRLTTVDLNQNQFDALVSFSYNCGTGALGKSTLLKKVNAGDFEGAARQFPLWNKGGGKVLPGLVRRRADEASMFRRPVEAAAEPEMPQAVDAPAVAPTKSRIVATASAGEKAAGGLGALSLGLTFADALGYGGQILPLIKTYGLPAFAVVMIALALGFALVKVFRLDDHAQGKTVETAQ